MVQSRYKDKTMNCIFCKIVHKEIPNYTVYEDDRCLAFLDIFPQTKGHTVVIPKIHAETVFDLNDFNLSELNVAAKRTMEKIKTVLSPDGFTVGWNHGEAGGQAVPHLHVHIFPRWLGDGGGSMHSVVKKMSDVDVKKVAEEFKIQRNKL